MQHENLGKSRLCRDQGFCSKLIIKRCLSVGLVLSLVASLGVLGASSASAQTTSGPVAQIWASKQASGNVEFGLSVRSSGARSNVALTSRYFLYDAPSTEVGTWYYSEWKVIGADPYNTVARVQVRRLVSGNLEFGLQIRGLGAVGESARQEWLPRARYFLYQATSENSVSYSDNFVISSYARPCLNGTVFSNPRANLGLGDDCATLLAAKDTLQGSSNVLSNWNTSTSITSWTGIQLNDTNDRVDTLAFGNYPGDTGGLTGSISPHLGSLSGLKYLNLDHPDNNLTGTIPRELGNLTNVEQLHLRNNSLTGSIPSSLSQLRNVKEIYLELNNLSGTIPSELGDLSSAKLQSIKFYRGQIETSPPRASDNPGLSGCVPRSLDSTNSAGETIAVFRGNLPWCSSASAPVAQVWASKQTSGNVEFGLSVTSAGVRRDIPLSNRFFLYGDPSTEVGTWYYSDWKIIEADSYRTDARVQVRRLVSGNLEFGLQVRDLGVEQGDNRSCLPSGRYFLYQAASENSKLYSSNLSIRPQMCS